MIVPPVAVKVNAWADDAPTIIGPLLLRNALPPVVAVSVVAGDTGIIWIAVPAEPKPPDPLLKVTDCPVTPATVFVWVMAAVPAIPPAESVTDLVVAEPMVTEKLTFMFPADAPVV